MEILICQEAKADVAYASTRHLLSAIRHTLAINPPSTRITDPVK
jgi:hypothetical protein